MTKKLTNQENYNSHIEAWKKIGYEPSKEELDDIQYLYKVGKYNKKGKQND